MDKPPKPKDLSFNDKTVISTPNPIYSSSMAFSKGTASFINDLPERLSDIDNSLGLLSIKSDDFSGSLSASALQRRKEFAKALSSLREFSAKHPELTSIPSSYLKPSALTESSYGEHYQHSESTITESDLLPGNTSTPRESLNLQTPSRVSLGESLAQAAASNGDMSQYLSKIMNTINNHEDMSFKTGEAAIAVLEKDEMSWKEKQDLPASSQDFSIATHKDSKMSLGSFFIQRSDNLPQMFARSPMKNHQPVPLIETSSFEQTPEKTLTNQNEASSLHISDIRDIIQSEQSVTTALFELMHNKKTNRTKSPKMSVSPDYSKEKRFNQASKQNLSPDPPHGSMESLRSANSSNGKLQSKMTVSPDFSRKRFRKASKENFSPDPLHGSMLSLRSASSLSSLPNGKLPIATTKTELIWGCIKPGKSSLQKFLVRNKSQSRVAILCSVSNPAFKIRKEGSDSNASDSVKFILQPCESRTLIIIFSPTTIGSFVDNLAFSSGDPNHKQTVKQFMKLYAYGGYANVTIHNVIKDTTLRYLLTLGNVDERHELRKAFTIKNTGSIPAFAFFYFMFNAFYTFPKLNIYPRTVVLQPDEEKEIVISLVVQKADFNFIKSKTNNCVIDIGKLEIVHGTEVDRARLRRVFQRAMEKNEDIEVSFADLIDKFPGEVIPNDIKCFKESISCFDELVKLLHTDEITVTLEQDLNQTVTDQFQDETALFHSLCENTAIGMDSTICKDVCVVEPTRIILTPPEKVKDGFLLTNNTTKMQYFEINSMPEGLCLKPKNGTIQTGETLFIDLMYTQNCKDKTVFKVRILLDNESFDVDVKVVFLRN